MTKMKIHERLQAVFTAEEVATLEPQQISLMNEAVNRVINKDGISALTQPRLEGIKEMYTVHLWSPGLSNAAKISTCMAGFECLSHHWNFFKAKVTEPVIDQVLNGVEGWTSWSKSFPVVIGVRARDQLFLLFRNPEEETSTTESTALAMVEAYDADDFFVCMCTDALKNGRNAFLVTRSRTSQGSGIFFELTESADKWEIGQPIGKIDPSVLGDFTGVLAFKSLEN